MRRRNRLVGLFGLGSIALTSGPVIGDGRFEVVFLVDASRSIGNLDEPVQNDEYPNQLQAVIDCVCSEDPSFWANAGTSIAVVTFADVAIDSYPHHVDPAILALSGLTEILPTNVADVCADLQTLKGNRPSQGFPYDLGGGTNLAGALDKVHTMFVASDVVHQFEPSPAGRLVVLSNDGLNVNDDADRIAAFNEASTLRQSGVRICAVNVEETNGCADNDDELLSMIANTTDSLDLAPGEHIGIFADECRDYADICERCFCAFIHRTEADLDWDGVPDVCQPPVQQVPGACCNIDGTCSEGETEASCTAQFQGYGTTCTGSCCQSPPSGSGADNCDTTSVYDISVPGSMACVGGPNEGLGCSIDSQHTPGTCQFTDPVVVTIVGDNSAASSTASQPDGCFPPSVDPLGEMGWFEAFSINEVAFVRLDYCCSSLEHVAAYPFLFADCTCTQPVHARERLGDPASPNGFAFGSPFCEQSKAWFEFGPLQPGTYYYPIYSGSPAARGPRTV